MDNWIDVNDRLPFTNEKKYGHEVYCCFINHTINNKKYRSLGVLRYYKGAFFADVLLQYKKEVTHWIELPKLPSLKNKTKK